MNKICLTFDVDWAPDYILEEVVEILESFQVKATFFLTHKTDIFDGLEYVEKGIHPYIIDLNLASQRIQELKELFPEALSSRSHSLTDSGGLNRVLHQHGIKIKSNYLLYMQEDIRVVKMPYQFELYEVPVFFNDGCYLFTTSGDDRFTIKNIDFNSPGLKVVDFHPIHIYLNTETSGRYEEAKEYMNEKTRLDEYINQDSKGLKDLFLSLLDYIHKNDIITYHLKELVMEKE